MAIHQKHKDWLKARGLDPDLAESLGLTSAPRMGGIALAVPFCESGQPVNWKYRLTSQKRHEMEPGAPLLWLGVDCLENDQVQHPSNPVVIVEGEWDWLTVRQVGRQFVLSVPNGAPNSESRTPLTPEEDQERFRFVWRSKSLTDRVAKFILAVDDDEPGRILAYELARRLGVERCLWVSYPDGCKDLNDVLVRHGPDAVQQVLVDARPYPVKGLYRLSDFPEPPPIRPISTGIDGLDDYFKVVPSTLTVVTGYAGQGKSSLIFSIVANLIRNGHSVAIGSFETWPKPILANTMTGLLLGKFHGFASAAEKAEAADLMEKRLQVIAQLPTDEADEMTLEYVLDIAEIAVLRDGLRVLVLDPWNEIEHKRRPDESETDYANRAIRAMKRFALRNEVAVILIAHPRKPPLDTGKLQPPTLYDISGSAAFANKADYGIVVHTPDKDSCLSKVWITKVRHGLPGKQGKIELAWDWERARYSIVDSDSQPDARHHWADDREG